VAALGVVGCGAKTATVSGKVYLDGKLLKGGNVTFASSEGKGTVSTPIKEDGTYSREDVPTGKVNIAVETESLNPANRPTGAMAYKPPGGQQAPAGLGGPMEDTSKRYTPIPEKYTTAERSGISIQVKSGTNPYDIQLKSK
jgi:hypothetical protein